MTKVLVVDDAAFVRAKSGQLLAGNGYVVDEAVNGLEAVSKYQQSKPDVVLMDITMPIMDGITAVREIRRRDPAARIIMCTALGQQAMVIEALKAGARDYIVKPYPPDRLLQAIRKLLG